MNANDIREIWWRANRCCEYCHLSAALQLLPFQIDHIVARQHGGPTSLENLALSCLHCNRFKGPNLAGFDAGTGEIVRLFHPRRDFWVDHFQWNEAVLTGLTPVGRITIEVLFINDPAVVALRRALREEGVL